MTTKYLKSPYPYFGGKAWIADEVWKRFDVVQNFVEPFFGSGAVLLNRPLPFDGPETINDIDGFVSNFWRAISADPEAAASYADWPVNENDLHARHAWLVDQRGALQARLEGDPDYFDARIAGYWCWGQCAWIGSGFCSGRGPWHRVQSEDGTWQLVHLGNAGQGVNRQRVHLGDAGQGVNRQRVHLGDAGQGVNRKREEITTYFAELSERLRGVRVCCGDWSRVCGPSVTVKHSGTTAVFLDPPYSGDERYAELYRTDSATVFQAVRDWAVANGGDKRLRIALCGYEGEWEMPDSWECWAWKARGGFGSQGEGRGRENAKRERVWFSPHCRREKNMFGDDA